MHRFQRVMLPLMIAALGVSIAIQTAWAKTYTYMLGPPSSISTRSIRRLHRRRLTACARTVQGRSDDGPGQPVLFIRIAGAYWNNTYRGRAAQILLNLVNSATKFTEGLQMQLVCRTEAKQPCASLWPDPDIIFIPA